MAWAVGETSEYEELAEALTYGLLWVAEASDSIQGFLLAGRWGEHFLIWEVAVDQRFRGQRVGAALVDTACAEASRRGFAMVALTTDRTLPWNAPLYARLGFEILEPEHAPVDLQQLLSEERNPHLRCLMQRPT